MPRDLADLALSAGRMATAVPTMQKAGVTKAAKHTTTIIRQEIRKITGDMRLSGVGKKGASVGAGYEIFGQGIHSYAEITSRGPLRFIEFNTKAHRIPRKKARKKKYAVVDGHPYNHANHPGTTGQHPFERGARKAGVHTAEIFQDEMRAVIRKAWL